MLPNIWGHRANPYAGYDIIIEYPKKLVDYESILKNFKTQISATSRGLFIFHPVDKKWEVFRKPVNQDAPRVILPENSAELYKELDKISSMEEAQKRKELIKEKSKNIIFTSEAKALAIAFEHEKLFRDVIDELHEKYGLREEFKKKKNFIELAKISIHELFCEIF